MVYNPNRDYQGAVEHFRSEIRGRYKDQADSILEMSGGLRGLGLTPAIIGWSRMPLSIDQDVGRGGHRSTTKVYAKIKDENGNETGDTVAYGGFYGKMDISFTLYSSDVRIIDTFEVGYMSKYILSNVTSINVGLGQGESTSLPYNLFWNFDLSGFQSNLEDNHYSQIDFELSIKGSWVSLLNGGDPANPLSNNRDPMRQSCLGGNIPDPVSEVKVLLDIVRTIVHPVELDSVRVGKVGMGSIGGSSTRGTARTSVSQEPSNAGDEQGIINEEKNYFGHVTLAAKARRDAECSYPMHHLSPTSARLDSWTQKLASKGFTEKTLEDGTVEIVKSETSCSGSSLPEPHTVPEMRYPSCIPLHPIDPELLHDSLANGSVNTNAISTGSGVSRKHSTNNEDNRTSSISGDLKC